MKLVQLLQTELTVIFVQWVSHTDVRARDRGWPQSNRFYCRHVILTIPTRVAAQCTPYRTRLFALFTICFLQPGQSGGAVYFLSTYEACEGCKQRREKMKSAFADAGFGGSFGKDFKVGAVAVMDFELRRTTAQLVCCMMTANNWHDDAPVL